MFKNAYTAGKALAKRGSVAVAKTGVVVGTAVASFGARAAATAIDTTAATEQIVASNTAIVAIGGAILGVCVLIACFMWVRKPIK